MTYERQKLGKHGERLAIKKIKALGYKVLDKNYRCPLGEIDLIAQDGQYIVFVEIKTRKGRPTSYAKEAITYRKKQRLSKIALYYLKHKGLIGRKARFDVIAICIDDKSVEFEIIHDAFHIEPHD
jgi:putative endonuclease